MNPINERLPTLLPLAIPHLVTPRVIEAAAAYCVGAWSSEMCLSHIQYLPPLDYKVGRCINFSHAGLGSYRTCAAIIYSLECELDAIYGTSSSSSSTPP